jgi:hypothetical protein
MNDESYQRRIEIRPSLEHSLVDQTALARDAVVEQTGRRVHGFRAVNGTLAQRVEGNKVVDLFCHANITFTVRDGFKDVSGDYRICRRRRHWIAALNPTTGALSGRLTIFHGPPGAIVSPYGFEDDSGPAWIDTPGQYPKHAAGVAAERDIDEFIVGVSDSPGGEPVAGFAGKYFVVIVEFIPRGYKVWISLPKPLSDDQLRAALGFPTTTPYPASIIRAGPPDLAAFRWIAHDTWQPYA